MQTLEGNAMATTAGRQIMRFEQGRDSAIDVTYSAKPDNQVKTVNYREGSFTTTSYDNNLALGQNPQFTIIILEKNIINDYQTLAGSEITATNEGNVMGFDQGVDADIDVTYPTKPVNQNVSIV